MTETFKQEENLVFLDCETTGLDDERHEIWNLAYILDGVEKEYYFDVDLTNADPKALEISHFWDKRRYPDLSSQDAGVAFMYSEAINMKAFHIAKDLRGRHIVGACPWFDSGFLKKFMQRYGGAATWHYHLIDIEAMIVGYLAASGDPLLLPYKSDDLSRMISIEPPQENERHTALGDARWVRELYRKIMGY